MTGPRSTESAALAGLARWADGVEAPAGYQLEPVLPCRGGADEVWFPRNGQVSREAAQACAGCPIREQCLAYAMEWGPEFGVWAGLSAAAIERMSDRPRARVVREWKCGHDADDRYWSETGKRWRCGPCNQGHKPADDGVWRPAVDVDAVPA